MMHISRLSEELVIWMSQRFAFIKLPDRFTTGSSIMPQKKNPDVPETARGKAGRVYGDLIAMLTLMKGTPLAYNKDFQEDKEPVFDAIDTVKDTLRAFCDMMAASNRRPIPQARRLRQRPQPSRRHRSRSGCEAGRTLGGDHLRARRQGCLSLKARMPKG